MNRRVQYNSTLDSFAWLYYIICKSNWFKDLILIYFGDPKWLSHVDFTLCI